MLATAQKVHWSSEYYFPGCLWENANDFLPVT